MGHDWVHVNIGINSDPNIYFECSKCGCQTELGGDSTRVSPFKKIYIMNLLTNYAQRFSCEEIIMLKTHED